MSIKAVIWDLGGVLLRTEDGGPREQLAKQFGISRSELERLVFTSPTGQRAQLGEIPVEQHWADLARRLDLSPAQLAKFQRRFWSGDRLDDSLVAYVRKLRPRFQTGLLSNAFSDLRQVLKSHFAVDDAFDQIVISAEVNLMKPDPRIYHLALKGLGVAPEKTVFIDDFAENVTGAQAIGMQVVHFQNPRQALAELQRILEDETAR